MEYFTTRINGRLALVKYDFDDEDGFPFLVEVKCSIPVRGNEYIKVYMEMLDRVNEEFI